MTWDKAAAASPSKSSCLSMSAAKKPCAEIIHGRSDLLLEARGTATSMARKAACWTRKAAVARLCLPPDCMVKGHARIGARMLKFYTAGESHGQALFAYISGLPAQLPIDLTFINAELRRRQLGYGRGGRQKIEHDRAEIFAGVRHGKTIGAPIALRIENRDWANWEKILPVEPAEDDPGERKLVAPRPGHADLAGSQKFNFHDARYVLERASARETAARVAAGAFAKMLLREFGTEIASHTVQVGHVRLDRSAMWAEIRNTSADLDSPLRCVDAAVQERMKAEVDAALKAGDTVGGIFEVVAHNVPVGLGSHAQWNEKLDGRLAHAVMSIQAVKAVEIGAGTTAAGSYGSEVQDEISYDKPAKRFRRSSNRAGGLEGGITNGEDVIVRGYLKPISTLRRPLGTTNMVTKEPVQAAYERSDWCVVPAGAVAAEAMVALVLADAFLQKFGGDSLPEMRRNFDNYVRQIDEF